MVSITNEAAKMHLVTGFADALRKAVQARRGGQWSCTVSAISIHASEQLIYPDVLVTSLRLRGTLHGAIRLEISSKDAEVVFAEAVSNRSDVEVLWQMLMRDLVERLPKRASDAGRFAFSVESHGVATEPLADTILIGRMELAGPESTIATLCIRADDEMIKSLQVADWSSSQTQARGNSNEPLAPELSRVIDVPLKVTLRFGQRNMRLRDVLELNTGALIELDRQVEDPVDLILDERVIARGEVVIVDGNYGLRVTEIIEPHATVIV